MRGALRRGIPARQADRVAYPDEAARFLSKEEIMMTVKQLRDTAVEALNEQVEVDFKEELMSLFSAAKQGKFCYVFHNKDFSRAPYQFYKYLARGGFVFHIRKYPSCGYILACSLEEIERAYEVKVSWE